MNIELLRTFLMWNVILNGALLSLMSVVFIFAGDRVYRLHHRWFPMPRETFTVVLYAFLGFYKILVYVFAVIPFVAVLIMR